VINPNAQGLDYGSSGEWLRNTGPERDVVISSRVRLARNIRGFRFMSKADRPEREDLVVKARAQVMKARDAGSMIWFDLPGIAEQERSILVERHLISQQLAKGAGNTGASGLDQPRGAAVSSDESLSIMVNEEDHLRIQVIRSGLQLRDAWREANEIDDRLEQSIPFAFHERFGYLTACPTNMGTGIRVSVMLHLPALTLTNEIERVRRATRDMQLAVRGFYGEGSDATGDLFQVSNQTTLGKSEEEILDEFDARVIPQVIEYERQARRLLVEKRSAVLDDRVFRALGTLQNARLLKTDEAMRMLSHLRLGVEAGRVTNVPVESINRLMLMCQPAHLQRVAGKTLTQADRAEARATLVRGELAR